MTSSDASFDDCSPPTTTPAGAKLPFDIVLRICGYLAQDNASKTLLNIGMASTHYWAETKAILFSTIRLDRRTSAMLFGPIEKFYSGLHKQSIQKLQAVIDKRGIHAVIAEKLQYTPPPVVVTRFQHTFALIKTFIIDDWVGTRELHETIRLAGILTETTGVGLFPNLRNIIITENALYAALNESRGAWDPRLPILRLLTQGSSEIKLCIHVGSTLSSQSQEKTLLWSYGSLNRISDDLHCGAIVALSYHGLNFESLSRARKVSCCSIEDNLDDRWPLNFQRTFCMVSPAPNKRPQETFNMSTRLDVIARSLVEPSFGFWGERPGTVNIIRPEVGVLAEAEGQVSEEASRLLDAHPALTDSEPDAVAAWMQTKLRSRKSVIFKATRQEDQHINCVSASQASSMRCEGCGGA